MSFLSHALIIWLGISYAQPITPLDSASWKAVEVQLTTGECDTCNLSPQAKWYFDKEIIALSPTPDSSVVTLPDWLRKLPAIDDNVLFWIAAPELIETATLDFSGQTLELPDGQALAFQTIAKIPQNQSYWNEATSEFFSKRDIRLRGEAQDNTFVARTVWPLDFAISNFQLLPLNDEEDLQTLVQADDGGVAQPHQSRLLWERHPGAALESAGK